MPARTSQTDSKEHAEHKGHNAPAGLKPLKVMVLHYDQRFKGDDVKLDSIFPASSALARLARLGQFLVPGSPNDDLQLNDH
jgi:hypothetical protein